MGLSLRLQTTSSKEEDKSINIHKQHQLEASFAPSLSSSEQQQNKINDNNHQHLLFPAANNATTTSSSHVASHPPNRKARVSVRARCDTATVSQIFLLVYN